MYCPKCGAQNADDARFCRACGADVGNVLAVVDGKTPARTPAIDEKYIELNSAGLRGILLAVGAFIVSGVSFSLSAAALPVTLLSLMFGFMMLATGISRFVHARGLKALKAPPEFPALSPGQPDYIKPQHSIYDTDDLAPPSITERTTTHLKRNEELSE